MKLFPEHSFVVDLPEEKANAVIEKITGEYGKLVRESINSKPFVGWIKDKSFKLMPNVANTSVKLKGTLLAEGRDRT